ncbi:MAG: dTMP kinase [Candidatus Vogelbacteria bacterium]|nr:dTMP kinase [Candidatus Vogelbacteria bacterium]
MNLEKKLTEGSNIVFITLEGPNGVGKTTVINTVSEKLFELGFDVFLTKEPTKSNLGDFLKNSEESYQGKCLACIAAADRYFHIEQEVLPALSKGKLVISDRYVESSLVLQRLDGCTIEFIWGLHSQIFIPDLSIILVAKPLILSQRLAARKSKLSRFEKTETRERELRFYRQAGKFLSQHDFNVLVLKNESASVDKVADRIVKKIQELHQQRNGGDS